MINGLGVQGCDEYDTLVEKVQPPYIVVLQITQC
jgi:hypothetical protein